MATTILAMEHNPEAGSECPMLDFTDPISKGDERPFVNTSHMEFTS